MIEEWNGLISLVIWTSGEFLD